MMGTELQQQNLAVVMAMVEHGRAGIIDKVRPLVADDMILHVPEGLPHGGQYHGWEGYLAAFGAVGSFWSDLSFGPPEFAALGEHEVAFTYSWSGTIIATGKPVFSPMIEVWTVRDGKVAYIRVFFFDTKAICDLAAA